MIALGLVAPTSLRYDVLLRDQVVGSSVVTRTRAADGSGKTLTRTTIDAPAAQVTLETSAYYISGGTLSREVQDVRFDRDLGSGKHLQTIAEFTKDGVRATTLKNAVRTVKDLPAPPGLRRGSPWAEGFPNGTIPKIGVQERYATFDLTAVRWNTIRITYIGPGEGGYRVESEIEGIGRIDRYVLDAQGQPLLLTTNSGFGLRRKTP